MNRDKPPTQQQRNVTEIRKLLRVNLNLTMREAGILHSILSILESGDIEDLRRRNIKAGCIFKKLNAAEDRSLSHD